MTSGVETMMFDESGGFKPWHSDPQKAMNGLFSTKVAITDKAGLGNMTIVKAPITVGDKVWEDHFALVWKETGQIVGHCTGKYKIIQPADLVYGFFDPIVSRNEAIIKTCGILRKGEQFWALAQLSDPKYHIEMDGWTALSYILLNGWNNGMIAASACHTSIIVQCQNTNDMAMKLAMEDERPIAFFRHVKDAKNQIAMGHKILALADKRTQLLRDIYARMGRTKISNVHIQALLQRLIPDGRKSQKGEVSKSVETEREKVLNAFDSPINFTDKTRGTAMNLYQAVTYWLDHTRKEVKRNGKTIERDESSMIGSGADLREVAMNWCLENMDKDPILFAGSTDGDLFTVNPEDEARLGAEGQDRESYTDDQDRENYTA